MLAQLLQAQPVTLATCRRNCATAGSRPTAGPGSRCSRKGDARDPTVLERFVAAVRTVAPDATGTPVTIQEAGRLISSAFLQAGIIAVMAITVLLAAGLAAGARCRAGHRAAACWPRC